MSAPFEPIAIVGRGCVLPGCLTPAALWSLVAEGRCALAEGTADRWRDGGVAHPWTPRGGFVSGLDAVFDPASTAMPAGEVQALDPVFRWSLHAAQQALAEVARRPGAARGGLVMGNLSYPTAGLARLAEQHWLQHLAGAAPPPGDEVDPRNRFMSGLPALWVARALDLAAGSLALDAACASGLYAIRLACDRLHDRSADLMLAGAVNAADPLFLRAGFHALQALSPSGQSRPFHRDADGLLPAEGAAFVALKRLDDALADGDTVHGVIRGVGLGNDGRGGGFLSPSREGQVRALQAALAQAALPPDAVQAIECHATGTRLGDATEIASLLAVYGRRPLWLGSLKANLGHLITTSGVAGLLKTLGAMAHGQWPATPGSRPLTDALDGSGYQVPDVAVDWPAVDGQRTAAVSSFGFGGNNAHLLLQQVPPAASGRVAVPAHGRVAMPAPRTAEPVAVVGIGVRTHRDADADAFARRLLGAAGDAAAPAPEVAWPARALTTPPADLRQALGQQLLVVDAVQQALAGRAAPDGARTGVFVGMQTDPQVGRHGVRWRWPALRAEAGVGGSDADAAASAASLGDALQAAGVIGTMPNICANRLSQQFDLRQPGFTVSREELSGDAALALACRAIRQGEVDTAVVAAVDLCREPVHAAAAAAVPGLATVPPADAAVALVLKPLAQAERDGDPVLALLVDDAADPAAPAIGTAGADGPLAPLLGHAHAASGLLHVALAVQMLRAGAAWPDDGRPQPLLPDGAARELVVHNRSYAGEQAQWRLRESASAPTLRVVAVPVIEAYAAADRDALRQRVQAGQPGGQGPCRLALVGPHDRLGVLRGQALQRLQVDDPTASVAGQDGIAIGLRPLAGELAFVFTGAASAYPGMGRDLLLGLPSLVGRVSPSLRRLRSAGGLLLGDESGLPATPFEQLAGASVLCQVHAAFSRDLLGLQPQAALGLSSGETNALFALGAWTGIDALFDDIRASGLYDRELAGRFDAVRAHWGLAADEPVQWTALRVRAPVAQLAAAVARVPRAYLGIVNSPQDAVLCGQAPACDAVLAALGRPPAVPLGHDLAVHCEAVGRFAPVWRRLHDRPTTAVPGVRFYGSHARGAYALSRDAVADALTGQALTTADFSAVVDQAWRDGVRLFVEHGPRNGLALAIGETLGVREHLAVSLDRAGVPALEQAMRAAAQLWCAGVPVDLARLQAALADAPPAAVAGSAAADGPLLRFALRPPMPQPMPGVAGQPPTGAVPQPPAVDGGDPQGHPWVSAPPLACPGWAPPAVQPPAPAAPVPAVPAPVAPRPVPAPVPAPPVTSAPLHVLVEAHRRMAEAHRQHLQSQAEAWQATLAATARWRALWPGAGAAVAPVAVLLPPPPSLPPAPVPAPAPAPTNSPPPAALPGPRFDRRQLEELAGGRISAVFGPSFSGQDGYAVQVRMPQPPLLLCDRVLGIEGEPHSMGHGTIWTETDVRADSWYLHHGRMPPGVFIECGQADLLLISWLGVDAHNRGQRAYRLLGCELVFHGELPQPGETLSYRITIDGHAQQGDVRLFFFHYECRVDGALRISVRHGQAGFFTPDELAQSAGVIWSPDDAPYAPLAPGAQTPLPVTDRKRFDADQVQAYLAGDLVACFGPSHRMARTHTRTPRSPGGRHNFLGEVTALDGRGGPAGRGYLRVETPVHPDDWFFEGHFKNDPCMPGTLMADACVQAMSFYLVALGCTLSRDGWRFQPVRGERYRFLCRGQVTPRSQRIVYEVFVDEFIDGEQPRLFAHVLCTVDGRRAFLCERLGLELVPDWPLHTLRRQADEPADTRPVARIGDLVLDHWALLHCAWGRPSGAFGPAMARYDGALRSPRLPGPPYHFMTRITALEGEMGAMRAGARLTALYDIEPEAWYFSDNPAPTLPLCVLMEAALQPCGWLASYTLDAETGSRELLFRNLDGEWRQFDEVRPTDRTLRTDVELRTLAKAGGLVIVKFSVRCQIDGRALLALETAFGFFPPEAMADQRGFRSDDADLQRLHAPGGAPIELAARPAPLFGPGRARLPQGRLLMLDRIAACWPDGGEQGLGAIRAEKDVDPGDWFFQAHFFQDPVQPGSLGVEAVMQALQALVLLQGLHQGLQRPRFEPVALQQPLEWHYRGQVTPDRQRVVVECEVLRRGRDDRGLLVTARARLWVDGLQVYQLPQVGLRLVEEGAGQGAAAPSPAAPLLASDGTLDAQALHADWLRRSGRASGAQGLAHDIVTALARRFVRRVVLADPAGHAALAGRPVLYLANHQTGVESLLFLVVAVSLSGTPVAAIAKQEHQDSWIGRLLALAADELGGDIPVGLLLFDRSRPAALLDLLQQHAQALARSPRSLLVHVDGTRARQAGQPVQAVSAVLIDLALAHGLPIVPVRFVGGLPVDPLAERAEFPHAFGRQDLHLGAAIAPAELAALPFAERAARVIGAIQALGPAPGQERPLPADDDLAATVAAAQASGLQAWQAVVRTLLAALPWRGTTAGALLQPPASGADPVPQAVRHWLGMPDGRR